MSSYIGLIHRAETGFAVSFPDFPAVTATGRGLDEARAHAQDVLTAHVARLLQGGLALPAPSSLDAVMFESNGHAGVAILVSVKAEPTRAIRVNVTMPQDVLAALDTYAETHGFSRSGLLTQAVKKMLAEAMPSVRPGSARPGEQSQPRCALG